MHLQSAMQVLGCVYDGIRTVLRVAYVTYASVQITGVYMGWAYTSVQITPLQDFGAEWGGGGLLQGGLVLHIYGTSTCT